MTKQEKTKFDLLRVRFIEWLGANNYSVRTREEYDRELKAFIKWVEEKTEVSILTEILPAQLNQYQFYLCSLSDEEREKSLSISTQSKKLAVVRSWFEWLVTSHQLSMNPTSGMQMPRMAQRLPREVLTQVEARILLESTPIEKPRDIRDRAILEVLYGSGIRRNELINLTIYDTDLQARSIRVKGKGGGERLSPITEAATVALKLYLEEVRPKWVSDVSGVKLFLSSLSGCGLCNNDMKRIVNNAASRAGIKKTVTPHLLRHSCATHLLQEGADIRYIQRLLGHRKLSTTEIYTQVEISDLQRVIERCHPREKIVKGGDDS